MAFSDALSCLLIPVRPAPRLPLDPELTPHLLLLRLDGIGDNICSWPALQLLRQNLPKTRISLAVGPWAAPLYSECPWVDEVIEWNSGLFGLFRGKGLKGLGHDLKFAGELRKRGFAAGIDLRGDLLSIALLRLIAPPTRVATVKLGGERLLTDPLLTNGGHETQRTYDIACASLGIPLGRTPRLQDWSRPEAIKRAKIKLSQDGWNESIPSVALCPLALWPWKQWPWKHFKLLALELQNKLGLQIVWFLENMEQAKEYNSCSPVFFGALDEVAAALSLCSLAVSNDSGLMHLAIAAGCKTVQLFGPGDAKRFAHHGEEVALHHDKSCIYNPCTRSGDCKNLTEGWCMDRISVEKVFGSCARLMSQENVQQ